MRWQRHYLLLSASILLATGCSSESSRSHDLRDGWYFSEQGIEQVDATTFSVTVYDQGSRAIDDEILYSARIRVPDAAVADLPFDFVADDGLCSWTPVRGRTRVERFIRGRLRVVEPRFDGLLVEYDIECENRAMSGRAVFLVEGKARESVWPYADASRPKSMMQRAREALAYAWDGAI